MSFQFEISTRALNEMQDAAVWYEQQSINLGENFFHPSTKSFYLFNKILNVIQKKFYTFEKLLLSHFLTQSYIHFITKEIQNSSNRFLKCNSNSILFINHKN